ncbi:protein SAWADEE HOMEODOMAIN HOMOLOG 2-like isoform X3 [Phalaenopsis equestris]|uniref:protein SAWADEE HOMEODOMAIN HOMOLOG 2-like isoform X3 n=1 Tax=Phalaenopsis equestris TaxID=78828 RepID=UPI0009E1CCD7|nr:protein SAWADEE HOMEODOMAIN HOMOLOG 2-like isoform X3 [Phalaenopsis equestris]
MVGAQSRARRRLAARFSRPEVRHMEMLLREGKDELSDPKFHQKLADEFNAKDRAEKKAIQAQQIQRWFLNRQHIEKIEDISSSSSSKEMDPAGDENMPNNAVQCFDFPEDDCDEISEGFVMEFEAKSYRDQAWYDVSTFLAHRVLTSGEVEKDETAYHFDAHVVSIERRIHDNRVCSCAFLVRYVHDQAEEIVQLSQLCRRP